MGFGILFFACFLTYFGALTPLSAYTYVLGSALMLFALYKLSGQNKPFMCSAVGSAVLLIDSLIVVVLSVFGIVGNTFYLVAFNVQIFLSPILLIVILFSIYLLAKEVGLRKIQGWCIIDFVFILLSLICDIVSMLVSNEQAFARLGLVCIVSQIIYSALLLVIVFNCYARICYEDDKDMENKTTGMPVFDFLNKAFDKASGKNKKNEPRNKGDK